METFYDIMRLIGGLGAFLIGFKILQDSLEKLANGRLKKLLKRTAKSKLAGVGIGMTATAIIQSSSASTVMIVGMVNTGLLTLYQAATFIMGANIGTTITAQIVSLQSFSFTIILVALAGIGIFLYMFGGKHERLKSVGFALAGLGLVFLGLNYMSIQMEAYAQNEQVLQAFQTISNPFLLLGIGILLTAVVQSSSAVTSVILVLAAQGVMIGGSPNGVLFLILGTNIGSCATALLSSLTTGVNGKRAAFIHLLFNTLGAALFFIILLIWRDFMDVTFGAWFQNSATAIAMFHTFFNIVCTLLFLPFTSLLVKISQKVIKDRHPHVEDEVTLDSRLLKTPSLALDQINAFLIMMSNHASTSLALAVQAFVNQQDHRERINQEIMSLDRWSKEVTAYMISLSTSDTSKDDEQRISDVHHHLGDIVRIGAIADNIMKYAEESSRRQLQFSDQVKDEIRTMSDKLSHLEQSTNQMLLEPSKTEMEHIEQLEEEIDSMRVELISGHIARLHQGECAPESSAIFVNLAENLERAGDHLTYIAKRANSRSLS